MGLLYPLCPLVRPQTGTIPIFQTVSELDFSHLGAKGIEIRSSAQATGDRNRGAYPLFAMMLRLLVPSGHFSLKNSSSNTAPPLVRGLFACWPTTATRKKSQGLCRRPNRCALLDSQMAKVELE